MTYLLQDVSGNISDVLNGTGLEAWGNQSWIQAVNQPFFDVLGPLYPLTVGFFTVGSLYVYSDDVMLPAIVSLLLGGLIIGTLPSQAQMIGGLFIFVAVALSIYRLWQGRAK